MDRQQDALARVGQLAQQRHHRERSSDDNPDVGSSRNSTAGSVSNSMARLTRFAARR